MSVGKTASIKLGLDASSYRSTLRSLRSDTERAGLDAGSQFSKGWQKGLKSVEDAFKSTLSSIKSNVRDIASGLGFKFNGIGAGIADAMKLQTQFRHLALSIRAGTGAFVDHRALLREVQGVAERTGNSTADLGAKFKELYDEVGDVDFAKSAIQTIATTATGTGESLDDLTKVAGTLNEKFGVTAEQLPDALASAVSLAHKGGVTMEDMSAKLGLLGASAKNAGLDGAEGFAKIVALANLADNAIGNPKKSIAAVTGLLDKMATKATQKKLKTELGVDVLDAQGKQRDPMLVLREIVAASVGHSEKTGRALPTEQAKFVNDLAKNGLPEFLDNLEKAGKSSLTYADVQKQFAEEMQTPEKQIAASLTRLEKAFGNEKIIGAVERLAATLPGLADKFGELVGFGADHPVLATAGAVGAQVLAATLSSAFSSGGAGVAGSITKALASGGSALGVSFGTALGAAAIVAALAAVIGSAIEAADNAREASKQRAAADGRRYVEGEGEQDTGAGSTSGMPDLFVRNPETGQLERKTADQLGAQYDVIKDQQAGAADAADLANQATFTPTADTVSGGSSGGGTASGGSAVAPNPSGTPAKVDIGDRELRVRITNPDEIGSDAAGTGGPSGAATTPGWQMGGGGTY